VKDREKQTTKRDEETEREETQTQEIATLIDTPQHIIQHVALEMCQAPKKSKNQKKSCMFERHELELRTSAALLNLGVANLKKVVEP
jgi:hypothetical protein